MAILKTLLENDIVLGSSTLPLLLGIIALILFLAWLIIFTFFVYRYYSRVFARFMASQKKRPELGTYKKPKPLVGRRDLRNYLGRIDTLTLKSKGQNPDKYMDELYHLSREFCIELLGIGHTYSDDELIALLTDDARDLARFHWHVTELKSHRGVVSKEKFQSLLSTFFVIASTHTKEKPGLTEFSKDIFSKVARAFENKKLNAEENQIEQLLFKEKQVFEQNLLSVRDACRRILDAYTKLPRDERVSLYPELISFYHTTIDNLSSSIYGSRSKTELSFFPRELAQIRNSGRGSITNRISKYFSPKKLMVSKEAIAIKEALQPAIPAKPKEEPNASIIIPRAPKPMPVPKPTPAPKPLPFSKEVPVKKEEFKPIPKTIFEEPKEDPEIVRLRNMLKELERKASEPQPVISIPRAPKPMPIKKDEPGPLLPKKVFKPQKIQEDPEIIRLRNKIKELEYNLINPPKPNPAPKPKPMPAPRPLPALTIPQAPKLVPVKKPETKGMTEKKLNEILASRMQKIDYVSRIHNLVAKARKLIVDKEILAAKSTYETIKSNFLLLTSAERRIVYPAVSGLYADLLKAMHEHPKDIKVDLKMDLDNQEQKLRMLLNRRR